MRDEETDLGAVATLRRYPVKSLLGEDLRDGQVTERGLAGDRVLALVHRETGKVASAKNPRQWRRLLKLAAATSGQAVKITLPDGAVVSSTAPGIDAVLTGILGEKVTLTDTPPSDASLDRADPDAVLRDGVEAQVPFEVPQIGLAAPEGTFFDFAPVHLITTSTLDRIAALSPRGTVEPERYRPNIVIRTSTPGFVENDWVGHDLRFGSGLVLKVFARTPRCAIPTLEHGTLPRDTDALRAVAAGNRVESIESLGIQPCAGVYAQVVHPGPIRVGDHVSLS